MIERVMRKAYFTTVEWAKALVWLSGLLLLLSFSVVSNAAPLINNNQGTWVDRYSDKLGIASVNQVWVDTGSVRLVDGQASGDYTTVRIKPPSFEAWGSVSLEGIWGSANQVRVSVLNPLAQDAIVIAAQDYTGAIDLSALNTATYPELRIKVEFAQGAVSPLINRLKVTWKPLSVLLLDKEAPTTVNAGQNLVYRLRYSVSYVAATDLVVWDQLPTIANQNLIYPQNFNQEDELSFVSATSGGQYTATAKTVKGINVPAHSVYWDLGNKPQGTTDTVTFTLKTVNGTLDGTQVKNQAFADAANAPAIESSKTNTIIQATPAPVLTKAGGKGIYALDKNYTQVGSENCFAIQAENSQLQEGRETLYQSVVYDDLSDLMDKVETDAGGSGIPVTQISGNGTYIANYTPPSGGNSFPAVVWEVGTLRAGDKFDGSFCVKLLSTLPPEGHYVNTVWFDSARTRAPLRTLTPLKASLEVYWPLDETPTGSFAKGDNLDSVFEIRAGIDDDNVHADATNSLQYVNPGDVFPYGLLVMNNGLSAMNQVVLLDRIPTGTTFKSAWFTDPWLQANARIFYSTTDTNDPSTPPVYEVQAAPASLDQAGNSFWQDYKANPPADTSAVKWVAFYIPAINSTFFNSGSAGWVADAPQLAIGYFDVKVNDDLLQANICEEHLLTNRGLFRAHSYTSLNGGVPISLTSPLSAEDDDPTLVSMDRAHLSVSAKSTLTPLTISQPGPLTYTVTIKNDGATLATDAYATITWPKALINGTEQYLPFLSAEPAAFQAFDPTQGRVTVKLGNLAVGAEKLIKVQVDVPKGTEFGQQLTFQADISHSGRLASGTSCVADVTHDQLSTVAELRPQLRVLKNDVLDLIPSGGELEYSLTLYNEGDAPSHQTYIVDRIPAEMVFLEAYAAQGERVWFSKDDNLPPNFLNPKQPLDAGIIATRFTQGTANGSTWTSPFGEKTLWVAWEMDLNSFTPPLYPVGQTNTVGLKVRNDLDGIGDNTAGSPDGTVIFNTTGVFSSELLQAIGNEVVTTIKEAPAIVVQKTGPSTVSRGETFDWTLNYYNNSGASDDVVTVEDTLPSGVAFVSASHTWNSVAQGNNAPTNNNDQPVASKVVVNADGTTTVSFSIAGASGYRGNGTDLAPKEGGTITLQVRAADSVNSGAELLNQVLATATNNLETATSSDEHLVKVRNAELRLVKLNSNALPIAGDTLTYTLIVNNLGETAAKELSIVDQLPTGLSFISGSALVLTPNYSLAAPSVSGNTLTWSVATNNALTKQGLAAGVLPAQSGDVVIQYQARVEMGTASDVELTNTATVSTTTPEDETHPNKATSTIRTPYADPAISKTGPEFVQPGERFNWNLSYWNNTRQSASGVVVRDTLPDSNGDGQADVRFLSQTAPTGVTPYYHSTSTTSPPSFDAAQPTSGGWSATPTTPVNHIAWVVGSLAGEAGPFAINVQVEAVEAITGTPIAAGASLTNQTSISLEGVDNDPTNNNDTHTIRTPGQDISLTKTASREGSIPGIAPGEALTYTLQLKNSGTQTAYGVEIQDTLPSGVQLANPSDNFTQVLLMRNDLKVQALDENGQPIQQSIPITRVISGQTVTWYLGSTTPSDPLYFRHIGLPAGTEQSFQVFVTLNNTLADQTLLVNNATAFLRNRQDTDPPEEITTNNTDRSTVTVFLPDLMVSKAVKNLSDGSEQWTEAGSTLEYSLAYGNLGNIGAKNTVLSEIIPAGTQLVPNSITGYAETGGQLKLNTQDGKTTGFEVQWPNLPAPANTLGEGLDCRGTKVATANYMTENAVKFDSGNEEIHFGRSIAVLGDVDGDGIDDLAVSQIAVDGSFEPDADAVSIVLRNADHTIKSITRLADGTNGLPAGITANANYKQFGMGLAGLGDLDGDGVPDLAVGQTHEEAVPPDSTEKGVVWILFLNKDGTVKRYQVITEGKGGFTGQLVYDADGSIELGHYGRFGDQLAALDVNNDGVTDLAVSEPKANDYKGRVHILLLKPDGTVLKNTLLEPGVTPNLFAATADEEFGRSLASLGDLDNDGVGDLAVSTKRSGFIGLIYLTKEGEVKSYVNLSNTDPAFKYVQQDWSLSRPSLAGGVDLNNDGTPDLILGSKNDDAGGFSKRTGAIHAVYLKPNGAILGLDTLYRTNDTNLASLTANAYSGAALAVKRDASTQQVKVWLTAPYEDTSTATLGAVWQLALQANNASTCQLNGEQVTGGQLAQPKDPLELIKVFNSADPDLASLLTDGEYFGSALANLGDLDKDGFEDLLVGSSSYYRSVNGSPRGAVYVLFMGPNYRIKSSVRITDGAGGLASGLIQDSARFGTAVAVLGDISGDGTTAIAVGAPGMTGQNSEDGGVFILFLNTDGTVNRHYYITSNTDQFQVDLIDYSGFGSSLAVVSGFDSTPTLLVGVPNDPAGGAVNSKRGAVYFIYLGTNGSVNGYMQIARGMGGFPASEIGIDNTKLGVALTALGDLDGNGTEDFAVSAQNPRTIYIVFTDQYGFVQSVTKHRSSDEPLKSAIDYVTSFGSALARIDDQDGDGVTDLLIGDQKQAFSDVYGEVWLVFLNKDGSFKGWQRNFSNHLSTNPTLESGHVYGGALAVLGDMDNDGSPEIAVGAHASDIGGLNRGSIYLTSLRKSGYKTEGQYEKLVQASCLTGWRDFIVDQELPKGTSVEWSILTPDGSQVLYGPNSMSSGFASVSQLPANQTEVLVRAILKTTEPSNTPQIKGWQLSYDSCEQRKITFQVTVDDPVTLGQTSVDNTASISSSTPEVSYANNTSEDDILLRLTDLEVSKTAQPASVYSGDHLEFTLNWKVLGPQAAVDAVLTDTLPEYFFYQSATPAPSKVDGQTLTWNLGDQAVNAQGEIRLKVFLYTDTPTTTHVNTAQISNQRQETDLANNTANAPVIVLPFGQPRLANVYVNKTGPATARLGTTFDYTLSYGNNGGGEAVNAVITDTLPDGISFVSATPAPSQVNGQVLQWDLGTLADKATGSITLKVQANTDYLALDQQTRINKATISTTSSEVSVSDNTTEHPVTLLGDPVSIGGYVWFDVNANRLFEATEQGIKDVTITLTGTDVRGNVVQLTQQTAEDGSYSFTGLVPGTYQVQETQPATYRSTTDLAGVVTGVARGTNTDYLDDQLTTIALASGERGLHYDFGETRTVRLGNYIWLDNNGDGLQGLDEIGVAGAVVSLYQTDGVTPAVNATGQAVSSMTTTADGLYQFDSLWPGQYVVRVQPPANYAATVSGGSPDNSIPNDSNGEAVSGQTYIQSLPVTLAPGQEPNLDGDDTDGNLTVDIGLVRMALDFGDLADTAVVTSSQNYSTLQAHQGAYHRIVADFSLGSLVDADVDGQASADALGDGDDEDALAALPDFRVGQSGILTLPVTHTNATLGDAFVYGFVDWNNDGDFADANEVLAPIDGEGHLFAMSVPVGSTSVELPYRVPLEAVLNTPLGLRLRLTTDALPLDGNGALGFASNGEVEDYLLTVQAVPDIQLLKTVTPATAKRGETVEYTLTVTNQGGPASGITIVDSLPAALVYSAQQGDGTYDTTLGVWTIGELLQGGSKSLTLSATVR